MIRRIYSDEDVAAALEAAHGDGRVAAAALGCSSYVIARYRRDAGIVVPTSVPVRWTPETVGRLREMALQNPRPPIEEIAAAFGTSISAVQTALSKFAITKNHAPARSGTPRVTIDYSKPPTVTNFRRRDCMCCATPFLSEGIHNRMCTECASGRREAA
jgi:hypothetical protein